MFRKPHLAITYAAGDTFFEKPDFWIYLESLCKIPDTTKVVITHQMSDEVKQRIRDMHVNVHHVPAEKMHNICRDRHLAYWDFLLEHGHKYKYIMITDSRDVFVQEDPFKWIDNWKTRFGGVHGDLAFLSHFVILTSEGMHISDSGFNCIEQFEFQKDVPEPFKQEDRKRDVVNGGVLLGTDLALKQHLYLMWVATMKSSGRITDQAALNYMFYHLEQDETYSLSCPQRDWLCLTGEGVKEGFVNKPLLKDGKWCNPYLPDNPPYCLIHQWDRVDYLTDHIKGQFPHLKDPDTNQTETLKSPITFERIKIPSVTKGYKQINPAPGF